MKGDSYHIWQNIETPYGHTEGLSEWRGILLRYSTFKKMIEVVFGCKEIISVGQRLAFFTQSQHSMNSLLLPPVLYDSSTEHLLKKVF